MSAAIPPIDPTLARAQTRALIVGAACLALAAAGALLFAPGVFFRAYLVGYVFCLGLGLGSLAIVMLHHLTGGAWGVLLRTTLDAGARTLPWMPLAFVPLVFGLTTLYVWADPAAVAHDPALAEKRAYLNVPFFLARAAAYLLIWAVLAWLITRAVPPVSATEARRLRRVSAGGLVVVVLTVTFALIDWVMSLEPHWYSTIYGGMVGTGLVLAAFAFAVAVAMALVPRSRLREVAAPATLNDVGSLLFAFVMLWMYLTFSQFLLIWSANLREEVPWYVRRLEGGWQWVALLVVVGSFVLPFGALLSRAAKRRVRVLGTIAAAIVVVRLIDLFWLVVPGLVGARFTIHWLDVLTLLGLGGLWLALFLAYLRARPLLDPALAAAVQDGHA